MAAGESFTPFCFAIMIGLTALSAQGGGKPCERIEFEPMPQLMCYGDTVERGESRPYAKDPTVIRHGGRYLMYYSVRYSAGNHPGRIPEKSRMSWWGAVAESSDLVNWKRLDVIRITDAKKFSVACAAPCVRKIDGKIHLFHQACRAGVDEKEAIWHATSEDGVRFVSNGDEPVFRPDNKWAIKRAIDAEVYRVDDRLILLYAGRPRRGGQALGMAWAPYGSSYRSGTWTELTVEKPLLAPELPWEMRCIEAGTVIRRKGIWYMFYAGAFNHERQQIGVAWSADGISYKRMFHHPVFPHGPEGSWNAWESGHPGVFEDDDGQVYLFYQGKSGRTGNYRLSCVKVRFVD